MTCNSKIGPYKNDLFMRDDEKNSFILERKDCEFHEFRPSLSKPIINCDIKYRMGRDGGDEEAE